jgi:hypothetical protein
MRPATASNFLSSSGSRASGAVIKALSRARLELIGHSSCSRGKSRARRATSAFAERLLGSNFAAEKGHAVRPTLPKSRFFLDNLALFCAFGAVDAAKTGRIARTNIPKQFGIDRAYRVVEPGHVAEQTAGLVSIGAGRCRGALGCRRPVLSVVWSA